MKGKFGRCGAGQCVTMYSNSKQKHAKTSQRDMLHTDTNTCTHTLFSVIEQHLSAADLPVKISSLQLVFRDFDTNSHFLSTYLQLSKQIQ